MNKIIFTFVVIGLASILWSNQAISQDYPVSELPPVTITAKTSKAAINSKVTKSFAKYFKDATNQKWYAVEKKYLVDFIEHEQNNSALFTKSGRLIYHISFGEENNLPQDIRKMVKSSYFDQDITRVYNVKQDDRNIWVVSLEDTNDIIMVRVENNELEETTRIQKT